MKTKKYEVVTVRMSTAQKTDLIAMAEASGASLNQFILIQCKLQSVLNESYAKRGVEPKARRNAQ